MKKISAITVITTILLIAILMGCGQTPPATKTPPPQPSGSVLVSFDYEKQSGFASNQFAVWIEDTDGNLIKTLYATRFTAKGGYENRPDAIPTCATKSGLSSLDKTQIDAITGATPKAGTLSYIWDMTDSAGKPMPKDREYVFCVEGSLRWKNRVLFTGTIKTSTAPDEALATPQFIYEKSENQPALSEASPENNMIQSVRAVYKP